MGAATPPAARSGAQLGHEDRAIDDRNLRAAENRSSDALRLLRRELAPTENRNRLSHATAARILTQGNAAAAKEPHLYAFFGTHGRAPKGRAGRCARRHGANRR